MSTEDEHTEALIVKKAEECVQYILFCYMSQNKVVIRKTDLNKNIIKDYSRSFRTIFDLVIKYMHDIFGLVLVPLDGTAGKYGIRNKFQYDSSLLPSRSDTNSNENMDSVSSLAETDSEFQDQFKYSMLMIALSLIFMNENEIDAVLFWQSLGKIGIKKDEKRHKYLGDVHKYFTSELVKEGYLEYDQLKGIDPPTFKFKWGQRSKLEISKMSVLEFVCEVYGGVETCKPNDWIAQYAEAQKVDDFNSEEGSPQAPQTSNTQAHTQARNYAQNHNDEDDERTDHGRTQTRSRR